MSTAMPAPHTAAAAAAAAETRITRNKSALELKLETLEKEYARLLREIAKKKAAFEQNEQAARDAENELQLRLARLREACLGVLAEIRAVFERLLGSESRLNAKDKGRVRRLYAQLVPNLDDEDEDDDFEGQSREHDFDERSGRHARGSARGEGSEWRGEAASESAPKPREAEAAVLRAVFRRLAIALHPDKVRDPKEKERRTAIMKQITAAYEAGDVARLLEIEATWLLEIPVQADEVGRARRFKQLTLANKELRRQLRALTARLKALKQSLGRVVAKKKRRSAYVPVTEGDLFVRQLERELGEFRTLRDFAQRFASGAISLAEFLRGPRVQRSEVDDVTELILDMLEGNEDPYEAERPRRSKRRRR